MIELTETGSLADFTQNTDEAIRRLKESGEPEVLTVDGRPVFIIQDIASYERLLDRLDRLETIEAVREGLEQMKRGEGKPLDEAFAELYARLGIEEEP